MNRRDALKSLAAVAAGGSLSAAGAVTAPATPALPVVYFLERRPGVYQSILLGQEHIGFIGPEMTRNRVMEWASDFGFQPVFCGQFVTDSVSLTIYDEAGEVANRFTLEDQP